MLCYVMLCYVMLCYVMLCYVYVMLQKVKKETIARSFVFLVTILFASNPELSCCI